MEPDLRYPIGKFQRVDVLTDAQRHGLIDAVAEAPAKLRSAIAGLNDRQLDTPYRPGGWTVRQVSHHVPDSHLNAYVRLKLALTETEPTIKTYEEARWAELGDVSVTPIETSLALLENLHKRWVALLRSLAPVDFVVRFGIPNGAPPTWTFCSRNMPGTAATTLHTSRRCESAMAGADRTTETRNSLKPGSQNGDSVLGNDRRCFRRRNPSIDILKIRNLHALRRHVPRSRERKIQGMALDSSKFRIS